MADGPIYPFRRRLPLIFCLDIIIGTGDVAQLGERRVRNAKVGSSILLVSTKQNTCQARCRRIGLFLAQSRFIPYICKIRHSSPDADLMGDFSLGQQTDRRLHPSAGLEYTCRLDFILRCTTGRTPMIETEILNQIDAKLTDLAARNDEIRRYL